MAGKEGNPRKRLSLSTRVLIGLALGGACGLVFGEPVAFLGIAGEVFVRLLQMSVLPYLTVSLVGGLGKLSYSQAASLAKRAGGILLVLWGVSLVVVLVIPLGFPDWETASFFSSSLVEDPSSMGLVDLYVPTNPFNSLANSVVPAVVLFSAALGIALIGVKEKQGVLDLFASFEKALAVITRFVVNLAPYGVFAIVAAATGTMSVDELSRVQVYVVVYIAAALLLTLWTLPALVTVLTPLRYRDVLGPTRDALVTAFATGNVFVVLPVLSEEIREILARGKASEGETRTTLDVIIPTSYNFPKAGNVLALSFVFFAGWISSATVSVGQYPMFAVTGLVSIFGGVTAAMPFLLDLMRVPADTFQLFVALNSIVMIRFGSLLSAVHILVLAVLSACAMTGRLRFGWWSFIRYVVVTAVLTVGVLVGIRTFFERVVGYDYRDHEVFSAMEMQGKPVATVLHEALPEPVVHDPERSRLDEIRARGFIRVGCNREALPFAFFNASGTLVGFDVEMAHGLARELGVSIEFVFVHPNDAAGCLEAGICDIFMSGFAVTTERAERIAFSRSYIDQTLAFIVRDHRRDDFSSRDAVKSLEAPRLGVPRVPYYMNKVAEYLPAAEIVPVDSLEEFFEGGYGELDGLVFAAEAGSAWSLVHPAYSVAVPRPDVLTVPLAYAMPRGDPRLVEFVDTWLDLKKRDGTLTRLNDRWVLGKEVRQAEPRWSVIRNVLHWVD